MSFIGLFLKSIFIMVLMIAVFLIGIISFLYLRVKRMTKQFRNGQLNLLLVPFGNSCAAVCETIPATTLFVKTYFENDRSRFQNTNPKIYSYKYAQSSAEGI